MLSYNAFGFVGLSRFYYTYIKIYIMKICLEQMYISSFYFKIIFEWQEHIHRRLFEALQRAACPVAAAAACTGSAADRAGAHREVAASGRRVGRLAGRWLGVASLGLRRRLLSRVERGVVRRGDAAGEEGGGRCESGESSPSGSRLRGFEWSQEHWPVDARAWQAHGCWTWPAFLARSHHEKTKDSMDMKDIA